MATSPESLGPPGDPITCRQCGAAIDGGSRFCAACGMPTAGDTAPDPLIGQVVADRYRIHQLVGRGGMGVVYKCEHTRMGKIMAIKLLHGDLARDEEVQRRFQREARAASRLSHPNTVSIFDFGTSDGLMYLVMEFVPGEDLGRSLRGAGHLAPARVAAIAAQACGSLSEAHDNGIVHRDLKPENLLICRLKDGRDLVKLLDFGLAKLREGEDRNEITGAGTLVGTPYYMAPEIIRGQSVDHRADVYALGAVIYRAVAGAPAFSGSSPVAVLTRHLTDELVLPSKRRPDLAIPPAIDAIVERCMRKDPADRYAQIDEVRTALVAYLESEGLSDSLLRNSGLTSKHGAEGPSKPSRSGRHTAVATRGDVEAFERTLRRGRVITRAIAVGLGIAALGTAAIVWREQAVAGRRPRDTELEPDNTAETATLIAPDVEVHGQIGARLASDRGDVDFFRLADVPPGEWRIHVELSGLANVDTSLELLDANRPQAIAVADDAPVGGREVIPGFRIRGGSGDGPYYVSVHERMRGGAVPMETRTDTYALRYTLSTIATDVETEPDDRADLAMSLRADAPVRGFLESGQDIDWWCAEADAGALTATLTPPASLDLELVVHPRDGTAETVVDHAQLGGVETARFVAAGSPTPCLIVRAAGTLRGEQRGNPDEAYVLRVDRP